MATFRQPGHEAPYVHLYETMSGNGTGTNATELELPHTAVIVVVGLLMACLSIVTIVGNFMVMLSFYLDKNIRVPSNYYIFSLAVSDFIIGLEGFPVYTYLTLRNNHWGMGWFVCDLWLSVDYSVCLASIYTVLCITIDRYCSVKFPAIYRNWRSHNKVVLIVAVIWLVPTLLFTVSIFGYGFFTGTGRMLGENECYVQFMTNAYLNMGMYIGYYWSTLIVMLILYGGIYMAARNLQIKSEEKQRRVQALHTMQQQPPPPTYESVTNATGAPPPEKKKTAELVPYPNQKLLTPDGVSGISERSSSSIHSSDMADTSSSTVDPKRKKSRGNYLKRGSRHKPHNALGWVRMRWEQGVDAVLIWLGRRQEPDPKHSRTSKKSTTAQRVDASEPLLCQDKAQTSVEYSKTVTPCTPSGSTPTPAQAVTEKENTQTSSEGDMPTSKIAIFKQEPSSLIERESTAPCVSPEESEIYSTSPSVHGSVKRTQANGMVVSEHMLNEEQLKDMLTSVASDGSFDPERVFTKDQIRVLHFIDTESQASSSLVISPASPMSPAYWLLNKPPPAPAIPLTKDEPLSQSDDSYVTASDRTLSAVVPNVFFDATADTVKFAGTPDDTSTLRDDSHGTTPRQETEENTPRTEEVTPLIHKPPVTDRPPSTSEPPRKLEVSKQVSFRTKTGPPKRQEDEIIQSEPLLKQNSEKTGSKSKRRDKERRKSSLARSSEKLRNRFLTLVRSRSMKASNQGQVFTKSKSENRARKALRTITFILGAFVLFWTPFYVLATIYGFCPVCTDSFTFNIFFTISYYLCYMNSPINPFCYAMANAQFKKTLTRILKGDFHRV